MDAEDDVGVADLAVELPHIQQTKTNTCAVNGETKATPVSTSPITPGDATQTTVETLEAIVSKTRVSIRYFIIRSLAVALTLFLGLLAASYCIGQLFEEELVDLFCDDYDYEYVHDYFSQLNISRAEDHNCIRIHRFVSDREVLNSTSSTQPKFNTNPDAFTVFKQIVFLCLALFCFAWGGYHCCLLVYDVIHQFCKNQNPRVSRAMSRSDAKPQKSALSIRRLRPCSRCAACCAPLSQLSKKYLYLDSQHTIFLAITSEVIEIGSQTLTLLVYGGVQLFSSETALAQEPESTKSFAVILGLNCVFTGLLWLLYATCSSVFRGSIFKSLLFVVDMAFDLVYTYFPILLIAQNQIRPRNLAELNGESEFVTISAIIAMIFLCHKVFSLLKMLDLTQVYKEELQESGNLESSDDVQKNAPYIAPLSCWDVIWRAIHSVGSDESIALRMRRSHSRDHSPSNSGNTSPSFYGWQLFRKSLLTCIGAIILAYGILVISWTFAYVDSAYEFCDNPSMEETQDNLQLIYWQKCDRKAIVFFQWSDDNKEIPCECRLFDYEIKQELLDKYNASFNSSHIHAILSWSMLQGVILSTTSIGGYQAFSADIELSSPHLPRKLRFIDIAKDFTVVQVSDDLGMLKDLEIFALQNMDVPSFPSEELKHLKKLKKLVLRFNTYVIPLSEAICELKELAQLSIESSKLTLPDCVGNLPKLEQYQFNAAPEVSSIPPKLLEISTLRSVLGYYTELDAAGFPSLENGWSKNLEAVYLEGTPLCDQLDKLSQSARDFIDYFDACRAACGTSFVYRCPAYDWGDGVCNPACETRDCLWDNGDCNMMCECDMALLGNGNCDEECNVWQCDYDRGDCNPNAVALNATCGSQGCRQGWLNDGWCDESCRYSEECQYDGIDCNSCELGCHDAYFVIIQHVASVSEPYELVTQDELCLWWDWVLLATDEFGNCTESFPLLDTDGDGYATFSDGINLMYEFFGLTEEQMLQVNCSMCLEDPSLY